MMTMMVMMNCFSFEKWLTRERRTWNLISSRGYWQKFILSQTFDMLLAGFKPAWNLISGLVQWSWAVVITTTPRCLYCNVLCCKFNYCRWQVLAILKYIYIHRNVANKVKPSDLVIRVSMNYYSWIIITRITNSLGWTLLATKSQRNYDETLLYFKILTLNIFGKKCSNI